MKTKDKYPWLEEYIKRKDAKKSIERRKQSIEIMKDHAGQFLCKDCFHGQTGNCKDDLDNGCEYWYNRETHTFFEDLCTMGKGHRDNHAARKKRGPVAFKKKANRRKNKNRIKCNICGVLSRKSKIVGGLCPQCLAKGD